MNPNGVASHRSSIDCRMLVDDYIASDRPDVLTRLKQLEAELVGLRSTAATMSPSEPPPEREDCE